MSRFLVAALAVVLLVSVGCQDKDKHHDKSDTKAMSADACKHCPGVQKATADGKCPVCGAKSAAAGDVCPTCPGVQTATAANTCSACGASLAKK